MNIFYYLIEIWGPFLVITPASTLHNWQQEVAKFIPAFKVVPYWGSPQERKILRQFWDQSNLHNRSSTFHIVITSYQVRNTSYPSLLKNLVPILRLLKKFEFTIYVSTAQNWN